LSHSHPPHEPLNASSLTVVWIPLLTSILHVPFSFPFRVEHAGLTPHLSGEGWVLGPPGCSLPSFLSFYAHPWRPQKSPIPSLFTTPTVFFSRLKLLILFSLVIPVYVQFYYHYTESTRRLPPPCLTCLGGKGLTPLPTRRQATRHAHAYHSFPTRFSPPQSFPLSFFSPFKIDAVSLVQL